MNIFKKLFKQSEDHLDEEIVNSPSFYSDDSAEEEHLIIENEEKQRIEKGEKREQIKKNKEQFIVDHEATKLGDLIIRDLGESSLEIVLGKT